MKRTSLAIAALVTICYLPSCRSVEFYEKEAFSDASMSLGESRTEVHWYQKVFYSEEGSAGGIGTMAGGGCGCY